MINKNIKWVVITLGLIFGSTANAGAIQYSDTNAGGALWNGEYPAHLQPFYVSTSGLYSMQILSASFDTYLWLYAGIPVVTDLTFGSPYLAQNDDYPGLGTRSLINNFSLQASTQYSLLTRGFGGDTGTFTAEISGAGDITLGVLSQNPVATVPTPPALLLLLLGLFAMRLTRRRGNA